MHWQLIAVADAGQHRACDMAEAHDAGSRRWVSVTDTNCRNVPTYCTAAPQPVREVVSCDVIRVQPKNSVHSRAIGQPCIPFVMVCAVGETTEIHWHGVHAEARGTVRRALQERLKV
jgi:hypothetical protein